MFYSWDKFVPEIEHPKLLLCDAFLRPKPQRTATTAATATTTVPLQHADFAQTWFLPQVHKPQVPPGVTKDISLPTQRIAFYERSKLTKTSLS